VSEPRGDGATVELYLLRHADAGDPIAPPGNDDARPLSEDGRRQAEALGRFLTSVGFVVDALVSSPRARARQTAEAVAAATGGSVVTDDRLAADLGLAELEAVLADQGAARRVALVGHDPDFSDLVAILCGGSRIAMKKGALARIDAARPLGPGGGVLRWLVPPDLLCGSRS
jgi:phosphohistidine phosphatase